MPREKPSENQQLTGQSAPGDPDYSRLGVAELRALREHAMGRIRLMDQRLAALGAPVDEVLDVDRVTLARLCGVRPDQVSIWTREGMPVLAAGRRGIAARYDAIKALGWWRVRKQGSAEAERARRDRTIADINEKRLAEIDRRLVPRAQVVREAVAYSRTLSERVIGLGRRLLLAGIIGGDRLAEVEGICAETLEELCAWADGYGKAS